MPLSVCSTPGLDAHDDGAFFEVKAKQDAPVADPEAPLVVVAPQLASFSLRRIAYETIQRREDALANLGIKPADIPLCPRAEFVVPSRGHGSSARLASAERRPPSRRYSCHACSAA